MALAMLAACGGSGSGPSYSTDIGETHPDLIGYWPAGVIVDEYGGLTDAELRVERPGQLDPSITRAVLSFQQPSQLQWESAGGAPSAWPISGGIGVVGRIRASGSQIEFESVDGPFSTSWILDAGDLMPDRSTSAPYFMSSFSR